MTDLDLWVPSPALPRGFGRSRPLDALYCGPAGLVSGSALKAALASGEAAILGGTDIGFTALSLIWRDRGRVLESLASLGEARRWAEAEGVAFHLRTLLDRLTAPRADFGTLTMDRPRVMGIVNVTPDSFSDGGSYLNQDSAVAHGLALLEAGADILDIGGESTRPGAGEIDPAIEAERVVPVIRELVRRGAVVSVDTRHARVMAEAVEAGAAIVNDISALEGDALAMKVVAESPAAVVLMHMQGEPGGMQDDPSYHAVLLDVFDYLAARLRACLDAGISADRIAIDPGIGFGKTVDHNLTLLGRLAFFHGLGVPVLLGASRKTFIGRLSRGEPPRDRVAGSLAAALAAAGQGVQMVRVHDVAETVQAVKTWRAMLVA